MFLAFVWKRFIDLLYRKVRNMPCLIRDKVSIPIVSYACFTKWMIGWVEILLVLMRNEIRRKTHKINIYKKTRVSISPRLVTSLCCFLVISDPLLQGILFILSLNQLPRLPLEQPLVSATKSFETYFPTNCKYICWISHAYVHPLYIYILYPPLL